MYQKKFWQIVVLCLMAQLFCFTAVSFAEEEFAGLKFGVGLSLTLDTGKHDRIDTVELDGNKIVRVIKEHNDIPRVLLETHYFFMPRTQFWLPFGSNLEHGEWGLGPFVGIQGGSDKAIQAIGGGVMIGFLRKEKNTLLEMNCEIKSKDKCEKTDSCCRRECESLEFRKCEIDSITNCEPDAFKSCNAMDTEQEKVQCRTEAKAKCKALAEAATKVKDSFNIGIGVMMDPSVKILGDGISENQPLPLGETTVRTKETSQWGVLFMVSYNF